MDRHPAAYLRRSYVDLNSPGDISLEAQRAAVERLAHRDGHNGNVREYSDWGVSADVAKSAKRTAYTQLLADMEAGAVSAVYAFDVDRLYRDPRDLMRLQDAAQAHQVRIVTTGGELAIGDGDDRARRPSPSSAPCSGGWSCRRPRSAPGPHRRPGEPAATCSGIRRSASGT